jgi:hypothetical protein
LRLEWLIAPINSMTIDLMRSLILVSNYFLSSSVALIRAASLYLIRASM